MTLVRHVILVELAKDVGATSYVAVFLSSGSTDVVAQRRGDRSAGPPVCQGTVAPMLLRYLPDSLQTCSQDHDVPGGNRQPTSMVNRVRPSAHDYDKPVTTRPSRHTYAD